jgi:hypothetical protein
LSGLACRRRSWRRAIQVVSISLLFLWSRFVVLAVEPTRNRLAACRCWQTGF